MFLVRHAVASALVATALTIVAGVFVFARPHYVPEMRSKDYDMSARRHFTVQHVRRTFAAHGFTLWNGNLITSKVPGTWMRPLEHRSGLEVAVFGPKARLGWGVPPHTALSTVVGNVGVTYYGKSDDVLRRAKAAVADLRSP